MTVFEGAVDATFAAFGIDAVYVPAGGEPISMRAIAKRPDTIVGFGATRIHAETGRFEVRASEIASPRPGDELTVGGETFVIQAPGTSRTIWAFPRARLRAASPTIGRAVGCWSAARRDCSRATRRPSCRTRALPATSPRAASRMPGRTTPDVTAPRAVSSMRLKVSVLLEGTDFSDMFPKSG